VVTYEIRFPEVYLLPAKHVIHKAPYRRQVRGSSPQLAATQDQAFWWGFRASLERNREILERLANA
jgi:glycine/D-amino acid oxidase-like deaminating enzyme